MEEVKGNAIEGQHITPPHRASPITHAHTHAPSAPSTRTQRIYLHAKDPYPASRSATSSTRHRQNKSVEERDGGGKGKCPVHVNNITSSRHASSIANYTRAHARTLSIINTHATRLLTNYRSISNKQQQNQFNPTLPKKKRAERGGWRRKREIPCTSITLLPRIKHHQLHTRTRTRTLHHQHARNAFTYQLQIQIEQVAASQK